eukprot:TRINITY_DN17134_c1_g1_i1.p2 TRINITY_DN17134_c1_g1~~TRINITY_DN17134_c1_g1_i1.p2  ORF type:complete len:106 (+),score=0.12 TRINITY_DN17134_c1_g1_i1:400-717(+)
MESISILRKLFLGAILDFAGIVEGLLQYYLQSVVISVRNYKVKMYKICREVCNLQSNWHLCQLSTSLLSSCKKLIFVVDINDVLGLSVVDCKVGWHLHFRGKNCN